MEELGDDQLITVIISIFFIFFITFLTAQILLKTSKSDHVPRLPPGPWKLPIIGNLHQMIGTPLIHHRLRDLAKQYGPLMHLKLGETSNIIVTSPELAKEFLKTHDLNFATRPTLFSANIIFYNGRDIIFGVYGEYWRQMRKICATELLGSNRVKLLRPVREEEIRKLVDSIMTSTSTTTTLSSSSSSSSSSPPPTVNLTRLLVGVSTAIVVRAAFGKIHTTEESFLPILQRLVKVLGGFSLADIFPSSRLLRIISGTEKELRKLHKEADLILQSIVDDHLQRRRSPERSNKNVTGDDYEDLIDVLLNYTEDQSLSFPFTHVELKAVILDIFLAGSDTSSIVVEWAMSELLRHPEEMEKAQKEVRHLFDAKGKIDETNLDELQYLPLIVKETLRLHPPGPLFLPRESRETIAIGGYQIPAKSRVSINAWAIGRDPRYWNDPDKFMPSRFENSTVDYKGSDFQLIPFGSGRRICPGMQFGVIMVHILLANLLYHFDWKIPNQENPRDLDMSEDFGASVGRKYDLYVTPVLYCPK